ncbi:MAG: DNA polymerase III subunit alpha [Bacteroidia bacterium]|nr:DNA polymerase III subunit alpha [Bacteroidia bacterium]
MPVFSHLHVHTQFSLLDGAANISSLYKKAIANEMPALAITDHGNMFGAFKFVAEAQKYNTPDNPNKIKPIVGCEFYLVDDRHRRQFTKDDKDVRYHQLMLAKNAEGYKNLIKLCSLGYMEGLYGKYPRIDKELVLKYHKGLIATTCCLAAEVPRTILRKGEAEAEKVFKWWLDLFGEDYYVELQRHAIPEQMTVNEVLLKFARKYNVKIIASNDSHYVDQKDSNAHDILLCINTGEKQSTPSAKDFGDDDTSGAKGKRFAFFNDQFYFKGTTEMNQLFSDLPEAIDNTNEIVGKIETLKLKQDIMLPNFPIPQEFQIHTEAEKVDEKTTLPADTLNQWEYLRHLTFVGAKKRYGDISPEVEERLNFELFTIKTMGFAGYFLIVADFINHGKDIGVFVGPGRGSAAGSVVAYCIGITNIDPIKYNLLFERFLNPDRKSMPDIDTDFDDEGRQKVIDYVVDKYGKNQVAQIVTYGTMAAKMSIKDVARVLDIPLQDANALAKLVPEKPGIELNRLILAPLTGEKSLKEKENLSADEMEGVNKLRDIYNGTGELTNVLKEAVILEGSVRGTGIHAAGIIIAPKDLTEIIPVATSKETELLITQFEGKVIEDSGVIKMDFLGLKTLTILRDALIMIKQNHGVDIDLDTIPLDDKKTFELYQRGETNGTFQFESPGMQKHLKDLKPDKFEDLIAMNALYRPGPIEYIPNFIARKNGKEKVSYDLPEMEEFLQETYGITVYQEQVMLLSQKLAGFTKGDADVLRKAMGKKDKATLDKMKSKFIEGVKKNSLDETVCEKVWKDWEAFAQYAFNKSHSTCYAFVAFQTAYLKAHYPAEYMASVLTHNLSNIDKVTFFMEESKRMGIPVLGPDINESEYRFAVNKSGQIRFGLGAVKGVGEAAVAAIVEERKANGPFKSIFDLVRRINLRTANKKTFESLVYGGGFDSFGLHRANYFATEGDGNSFLEKAMRYGAASQDAKNSSQVSLFGETSEVQIDEPTVPAMEPWGQLEQLKYEKDVIGFYISGHPLDTYHVEMGFCKNKLSELRELNSTHKDKEFTFGGMVTAVNHRVGKTGNPFGNITVEDYGDSSEFMLFGEDYLKYKLYMTPGYFVYIRGKVQKSWRNPDAVEFKITSMQLLSEVRDKLIKSITINISLSDISDQFIAKLTSLLDENAKKAKGTCSVKFHVVDPDANLSIDMPSRRLKVSPDNELLEIIQKGMNLTCRLN